MLGKGEKVCVRKVQKGKLDITIWREGRQSFTSGVRILMHRAWPTKERNWKSTHTQSSDVTRMTKIKWDGTHDWDSVMEAVQGEQVKKGSGTFSQSTSCSMQRPRVKPDTYLTGISWSKAKATLATQQWGLLHTTCPRG